MKNPNFGMGYVLALLSAFAVAIGSHSIYYGFATFWGITALGFLMRFAVDKKE